MMTWVVLMMVVMMTIGQQPPLAEHGKLGFEPAVKEKGNDELIITFTHYSKITFLSIFVEFMSQKMLIFGMKNHRK